MRAGAALRQRLDALRPYMGWRWSGELEAAGEEPTYQEARDYFAGRLGTTSSGRIHRAMADAAGLTDPGSRESRAFMRRLQRYERGERHPRGDDWRRVIDQLGGRRRRVPVPKMRSMRRVIELIERRGVTVLGFSGVVIISKDARARTVPNIYIDPELLHENGFFPPAYAAAAGGRTGHPEWDDAAFAFANAWGEAYGCGPVDWEEIEYLDLRIGT